MTPRLKCFTLVTSLTLLVGASAAQMSEPSRAQFFTQQGDSAYTAPQTLAMTTQSSRDLPDAPSAAYSTSKDHGKLHDDTKMLSESNWRPLTTKEKFKGTSDDLLNPFTQMSLLAGARFSQAINDRPYLGPGVPGYFRRYGLDTADVANVDFIQGSLFPWMFHEDPRYIPLDEGTRKRRAFYAMTRAVISRKDSGRDGFSKSEVFGAFASSGISNLYYAGDRDNGLRASSIRAVSNIGSNAAMNLLKEFWPDVAHKVKLNNWISTLVEKTVRSETNSD